MLKTDTILANILEIVACYGSDMTEDALNHRWRPLKVESTIVREARSQNLGLDMKNLPVAGNFPGKLADVDCASMDYLRALFFIRASGPAKDWTRHPTTIDCSTMLMFLRLTSILPRHIQIFWSVHSRRSSVPVSGHQERRRTYTQGRRRRR